MLPYSPNPLERIVAPKKKLFSATTLLPGHDFEKKKLSMCILSVNTVRHKMFKQFIEIAMISTV